MERSAKVQTLVDQLLDLKFMELAEVAGALASSLKEKGIDPFPTAVASAPAQAPEAAPAEQKKPSSFDVVLAEIDQSKKLAIIKEVRTFTGLGLKEAKDLVESAPGAVLKQALDASSAEDMKNKLQAAGATIELKAISKK